MSGKSAKVKRRKTERLAKYLDEADELIWREREPAKWRFIAHYFWTKLEPTKRKKRDIKKYKKFVK